MLELQRLADGDLVETQEHFERILASLDPAVCGLTLDTAQAAKGGIRDMAGVMGQFWPPCVVPPFLARVSCSL